MNLLRDRTFVTFEHRFSTISREIRKFRKFCNVSRASGGLHDRKYILRSLRNSRNSRTLQSSRNLFLGTNMDRPLRCYEPLAHAHICAHISYVISDACGRGMVGEERGSTLTNHPPCVRKFVEGILCW